MADEVNALIVYPAQHFQVVARARCAGRALGLGILCLNNFMVLFTFVNGPRAAQFIKEKLTSTITLKVENRVLVAILKMCPPRVSIAPLAVIASIKISQNTASPSDRFVQLR